MLMMDNLLIKLEDGERCMNNRATSKIANAVQGRGGQGDQGGGLGRDGTTSGGSNDNENRCMRCEYEVHGDKDCFHKNWECHACNKMGHLSRHCEFITNAASKAINKEAKVSGNGGNKKNIVLAVAIANNMVINRVFKVAPTSLILDSEATVRTRGLY